MIRENHLKKKIFTCLNIEDNTDADYPHAKRVFEHFERKNIGKYHDLYVQKDTLMLAGVFENF